jgi:hypothetical protein
MDLYWGNYMEHIKSKIQEILDTPEYEIQEDVLFESSEDEEEDYQELYTDVYVAIHNADDFYTLGSSAVANRLINSFLLEVTTLLRANLDTVYIESGIDFVKATISTPDGEIASYVLEDAIQVNTMIDLYNDALADNDLLRMDVGIGISTYEPIDEDHDYEEEGCGCGHHHDEENQEGCCGRHHGEDQEGCCGHHHGEEKQEGCCGHHHGEEKQEGCCGSHQEDSLHDCQCVEDGGCECGHHHHDHQSFQYPIDYTNEAYNFAIVAGSESIDPMVISQGFYQLLLTVEEEIPYIKSAFEEIDIDVLETSAYHGSIVNED